uniref:Uncharacterized protein n=1 Tax=Arundo donax TaxID=35708 RepID=A0A0A9EIB1_ARUDO
MTFFTPPKNATYQMLINYLQAHRLLPSLGNLLNIVSSVRIIFQELC